MAGIAGSRAQRHDTGTLHPHTAAHSTLRCPKRNKAKRATRKGRICPARSALLSVGRVQGATFSLSCSLLLSLLSLFAGACFSGAVLSLSVAWSMRVYAAPAQTHAQQQQSTHTFPDAAARFPLRQYGVRSVFVNGPCGFIWHCSIVHARPIGARPFPERGRRCFAVSLPGYSRRAGRRRGRACGRGRGRGVLFRYGGWASCALVCALPTCLHFSCFGQCPPPLLALLALLPAPLWAMAPPRAAGASVHNSAMAPLTPARPRWAVSPTATIRRDRSLSLSHDMRIRHGAGWPYDALCWCLCGTSQRRMPDDLVQLQLCNCPAVFAPFVVVHASLLLLLIARFSHGSLFPFPFPFLFLFPSLFLDCPFTHPCGGVCGSALRSVSYNCALPSFLFCLF